MSVSSVRHAYLFWSAERRTAFSSCSKPMGRTVAIAKEDPRLPGGLRMPCTAEEKTMREVLARRSERIPCVVVTAVVEILGSFMRLLAMAGHTIFPMH